MAFPLRNVRFMTRRAADRDPLLYPRLLRDRSVLPKIDIAIQYFESMVGRERRELETEVLVHFFGDHKLARCMVACLARSYRFRARRFDEIVAPSALRRLQQMEADSPRALRLHLYDYLNDFGHGFLPERDRDSTLETLETGLGLRGGELERLLYLDADEHAVLTRVGAEPRPVDVAAHYNFNVLESLLRHAQLVELELAEGYRAAAARILRLCARNGVEARASSRSGVLRLELRGHQDALGSWSRHGRKVARTLVQVLERMRPVVTNGHADLALRERRATLRLTGEALDVLGGSPAPHADWADEGRDPSGALDEAVQALRSADRGWSFRREPAPQAWSTGVIAPDYLVRHGREQFFLCVVPSTAHAARLAAVAPTATAGEPYVCLGEPAVLGPLAAAGVAVISTPRLEKAAVVAGLRRYAAEVLRPAA